MHAVRLAEVTKSYGAKVAVRDLNLEIPEGAIYGFIGPNGSGKTTTIRMILHIIHPDSGTVEVFGESNTRAANDSIGYLPEERGLYRKMTVIRLLTYFGAMKGMAANEAKSEAAKWLERIELGDVGRQKIESLSKGMAQKVQFICAAIARPRLLILDEPFSGLDPVNLDVVREQILALRNSGTTVIFSTHDMAAAEALCDSVFMIYRGNKVLDGSLAEITSRSEKILRVSCATGGAAIRSLRGVELIRDHGRYQDLTTDRHPGEVLRELAAAAEVSHFEVKQPSLHDIFVDIAQYDPENEEAGTR